MFSTSVRRFGASLTTYAPPMRVAIVGSGPSGFYAASRILHSFDAQCGTGENGVDIHMYERLPTPFGLVRYGVAPDHPEVRNVENKFDEVARDPRFTFLGNVQVTGGADVLPSAAVPIPLSCMAPYYTHILFAYGASDARHLHLPGTGPDGLQHIHTAFDFVQWYNGHPDAHTPDAPFPRMKGHDLRHVAVVGAGNVALDVARILLRQCKSAPKDETLQYTDAPQPVLERLRTWDVESVDLYVRRGSAQLAFTNKELREMLNLPHAPCQPLDPAHLQQALAEVGHSDNVSHKRAMTRLLTQLAKGSKTPYAPDHTPRWGLQLLRSPKAFYGDKRVRQAEWDVTEVRDGRAVTTGATETTPADLVLASVGYRSQPLAGTSPPPVPFDSQRHIIPNERRRVIRDGQPVPGMYVSGWLATGPVGIIVSTMLDAFGVADEMLTDWHAPDGKTRTLCASVGEKEALRGTPEALRGQQVVSYADWLRIDAAERERGQALGKPREKFVHVQDMLQVL